MSELLSVRTALPTASHKVIEEVGKIETRIRQQPQTEFTTVHVFHAGMYARTARIPAGVVFTSVLIKRATLLILNGEGLMLVGEEWARVSGYNVLTGAAGRKQVYATRSAMELTMIFPTTAKTVEEAEAEFTDEADSLLSRQNENDIVMTEAACLESQPLPRS